MKFFFTYVVEIILVVFLITQIAVPVMLWIIGNKGHYSRFLWFFRGEEKGEPKPAAKVISLDELEERADETMKRYDDVQEDIKDVESKVDEIKSKTNKNSGL